MRKLLASRIEVTDVKHHGAIASVTVYLRRRFIGERCGCESARRVETHAESLAFVL